MNPRPGDFFIVRTGGWQAWVIRTLTRSVVNHAGILVPGGRVVEAEPAGARLGWAKAYPDAIWSQVDLSEQERAAVTLAATNLLDIPYSWWDCACIGLADTFGHRVPLLIRRRLERTDRLMCSALVDYAYDQAGVHLFTDGRLFGDVSPGDLLPLCQPNPAVPQRKATL